MHHRKRADPGFDDNVCVLDYTDGNWLFIMPGSACKGEQCGWNLSSAPYVAQPPESNRNFPYVCDNAEHELPWLDYERPTPDSVVPEAVQGPNRYACRCGAPLTTNGQSKGLENCGGRCQTPWQAEFGKRCNIVTEVPKQRGNWVGAGFANLVGATQGMCLPMAASYTFPGTTVKQYIDEIGIGTNCTGELTGDLGTQSICSCDGALPATVFGRTLAERDPCGLEKSGSKAWIAGPVVGGVAALAVAVALGYVVRRRRQRKAKGGDLGSGGEIPLRDLAPPTASSVRRLSTRRSLSLAQRETPAAAAQASQDNVEQTTSQVDSVAASSTDSGVGILGAAAQPAKAATQS